MDFQTRLLKAQTDAAAAEAEYATPSRDYANMMNWFVQAEEAYIDFVVLSGLEPGNCEYDPWLTNLRQKVQAITEPPAAAPSYSKTAVEAGLALATIYADVSPPWLRPPVAC